MLLLYGAGGHSRVVLDSLNGIGVEVRGIFDDATEAVEMRGQTFLGKYNATSFVGDKIVITIGRNITRKKVASRVAHAFDSVVDRTALVSTSATIGSGAMILQRVIVQAHSRIGEHVILNTAAQIDHDCRIGDFAHIAPGVILCGNVTVGEGTLMGAGSVVTPGVKIGKWCIIGAGAVVINDIPDGVTAVGNPAHVIKSAN